MGGAPVEGSLSEERPEGRAVVLGRSVFASAALAFGTIAGLAGAVLALLPAAMRRGPIGRTAQPRVNHTVGDTVPETASEPAAR